MAEFPSHNSNKYVTWTVFASVVSLLVIGIGWAMAVANTATTRVNKYYQQIVEIKTQLSQIQTDLKWVVKTLNEGK